MRPRYKRKPACEMEHCITLFSCVMCISSHFKSIFRPLESNQNPNMTVVVHFDWLGSTTIMVLFFKIIKKIICPKVLSRIEIPAPLPWPMNARLMCAFPSFRTAFPSFRTAFASKCLYNCMVRISTNPPPCKNAVKSHVRSCIYEAVRHFIHFFHLF